MGDIFDSVAQTSQTQPNQPSQATPLQPAQGQPTGDVFDQVSTQQTGGATEQPIGKLHAAWNWLFGIGPQYEHQGLVEQFENAMRSKSEETAKRMEQTAVGTNKELNDAIDRINADPRETPEAKKWLIKLAKEEYGGSAADVGTAGALADAAKIERGAATPGNAVAATAATFVPPLRLPIAAYYAVHGAVDALTPQQEDETPADAIQRRLLGAATVAGSTAGAAEGAPAFGKMVKRVGGSLIDYAPKIGKVVSKTAKYGSAASAVGSVIHGDVGGAIKDTVGAVVSNELQPKIEAGVTKLSQLTGHATNLVGNGMIWLGNLLKADMLGRQPLPLTKAALGNLKDVDLESVAEKSLTDVAEAESEHMEKMDKKPMSIVIKQDQPYIKAAQKQLGGDASIEQVGELARKLKSQDEYLAGVIQRNTTPRIMHGESTLTRVLAAQSNANLIKIAKSRGIDVTKEIQLKEKVANSMLVKKIIDDMSPEELQEIGDRNLENSRFSHQFGSIGQEAANTLALQEYFPNVKIPKTVQARTAKAVAAPKN